MTEHRHETPSAGLFHAAILLTGMGTMLLGPILPLLARRWHLDDAHSGLLLLAQFCGSFVGGVTISARLRRGLLVGMVAAAAGLIGFALAPGLGVASACIAVGGAGVGRMITALNILAGRRAADGGSALMRLNLTWSLGAMLSPLLAAWLTPRFALTAILALFAALFAVVLVWFFVEGGARELDRAEPSERGADVGVGGGLFVYFAVLLALYGGLETCLNGWLTTFALRYGHSSAATNALASSEYTMVLLLLGLTVGRIGASVLLKRFGTATLMRAGLGLATLFTAALATARSAEAIAIFAVLLGLSLSPVFPAMFALALATGPTARQAGVIMAASAIGAAALPWLMGVMSTAGGGLQVALVLPLAAAVLLLGLSLAKAIRPRVEQPAGV